ncbi:hypothetical protein B0T12DRAFT_390805 [Alternaria alternata]|nr:hypothetical protein B0T12DRAFT_390805 [Alternaria alternata]
MELDAMLTRRISPSEPVLGMRPPILGDVYVLILDSQAKSCKYDITRHISSIAIDVATNPKTTSSHSSITMRDFTDHIAVSPQKEPIGRDIGKTILRPRISNTDSMPLRPCFSSNRLLSEIVLSWSSSHDKAVSFSGSAPATSQSQASCYSFATSGIGTNKMAGPKIASADGEQPVLPFATVIQLFGG